MSGPLSLRRATTVVAAAFCLTAVWRSLVAVDQTQYVLVTQFGRHVATWRDPGLHWLWPWRSIRRFDNRLQLYNPRPSEFLTRDPKNVLLDVCVFWRISDPLRFLQRVTDQGGAEIRLHDVVWGELSAEIGRRPLAELVSEKPGEAAAQAIMDSVLSRCRSRLGEDYGFEVTDVRLKRVSLPAQNRQSVFDRMRAERERIARQYRAEGEEEATRIRAQADAERTRILAEARRDPGGHPHLCRGPRQGP
jgi:membrane protease subunit HflC